MRTAGTPAYGKIDPSRHDHVSIAVGNGPTAGVERVPARPRGDGTWELLRPPLYAMGLAAGDVVRILDGSSGSFSIVSRGGNVSAQFFIGDAEADDRERTATIAAELGAELVALGGSMDGFVAGLIVFTIPVQAGFPAIEAVFSSAATRCAGSQWQYANTHDPVTDEPLDWWERRT